ncbi:MAG: hypothetical protein Q9175_000534 [Cornicularia normoerica]
MACNEKVPGLGGDQTGRCACTQSLQSTRIDDWLSHLTPHPPARDNTVRLPPSFLSFSRFSSRAGRTYHHE